MNTSIDIPGHIIEIDGLNIHYEKVGNGPNVLLLLPGGIGTGRTDFSIQLSGKDNGLDHKLFTMIAWDPPGHGFSRPPQRVYDKDIYKRDADLVSNLMKKLGHNLYSILGWSDGAKTALLIAIKYQSSIDKMVIWGGSAYVTQQEKTALNLFRDVKLLDVFRRQLYEEVYGNELKTMINKLADSYSTLDDICRNEVHKIRCPTLVLHGDLDPLPLEHPKYLTDKICDSQLHRFKRGGHDCHQEFSHEFKQIVTQFLVDY